MNVGELGIKFECATIVFQRFVAPAKLGQEIAKIIFCLNEGRVHFQRPKIAFLSCFFLSQSNLRFRQFEVGFRLLHVRLEESLFQHFQAHAQVFPFP